MPLCIRKCTIMLYRCANRWLHSGHEYGLAPVWNHKRNTSFKVFAAKCAFIEPALARNLRVSADADLSARMNGNWVRNADIFSHECHLAVEGAKSWKKVVNEQSFEFKTWSHREPWYACGNWTCVWILHHIFHTDKTFRRSEKSKSWNIQIYKAYWIALRGRVFNQSYMDSHVSSQRVLLFERFIANRAFEWIADGVMLLVSREARCRFRLLPAHIASEQFVCLFVLLHNKKKR